MFNKNVRITILETKEERINGKPIFKEEEYFKCWAEIGDLYSNELYEAINIGKENTVTFKVRYCKKLKELIDHKKYKIKLDNSVYEIFHCDFSRYYKQYIILKCNMMI